MAALLPLILRFPPMVRASEGAVFAIPILPSATIRTRSVFLVLNDMFWKSGVNFAPEISIEDMLEARGPARIDATFEFVSSPSKSAWMTIFSEAVIPVAPSMKDRSVTWIDWVMRRPVTRLPSMVMVLALDAWTFIKSLSPIDKLSVGAVFEIPDGNEPVVWIPWAWIFEFTSMGTSASASRVIRLPTVKPLSPILKPSKYPYPLAWSRLDVPAVSSI